MPILVSVVIPTFRRNDLLTRCLDALLSQQFEKSAYEIIVVDDGAEEEAKKLVEDYKRRAIQPAIIYLTTHGKRGPAAARNTGWKTAKGSLIAFTDDDCIPEPGWLGSGTAAFTPEVDGVSGRVIVPVAKNPTDYELNASFLGYSEFVTANCFYRKTALEVVGGFDERFTRAWREDADLFFTLMKHGCRLINVPEARVIHPVRRGHWGISIREQSKSMFNALLYKKHPELYREKIHNRFLPHYYTILASSLLFLISLLLGIRPLAILTFSMWITMTGFFCMKRLEGTSRSSRHVLEMVLTSIVIPFLSIYWRLKGAIKFRVVFF